MYFCIFFSAYVLSNHSSFSNLTIKSVKEIIDLNEIEKDQTTFEKSFFGVFI